MPCFSEIGTPTKVHAACKRHNVKQACSEFEKEISQNFIYSKEQISILTMKFP